jgi:hypothetical protein
MTDERQEINGSPAGGTDPGRVTPAVRAGAVIAVAVLVAVVVGAVIVRREDRGAAPGPTVTSPVGGSSVLTTAATATTPTPMPISADETAAVAQWRTVWAAASGAPGAEDAALAAVSDPALVRRAVGFASGRRATNSPTATVESDGVISIADCAIIQPQITATPTVGFTGRVERQGTSWIVTALAPRNGQLQPCVPFLIAKPAIAGYDRYWKERPTYWDPADPTSPLISETTTGKREQAIREQLRTDQQQNRAFRGRPETHPEVIQVHSDTEVVILDCQLQDPGWGIYDRASGELTGESAPVPPGRRDQRSAVMTLDRGAWKVADLQAREGVACDYAPTTTGLPVL